MPTASPRRTRSGLLVGAAILSLGVAAVSIAGCFGSNDAHPPAGPDGAVPALEGGPGLDAASSPADATLDSVVPDGGAGDSGSAPRACQGGLVPCGGACAPSCTVTLLPSSSPYGVAVDGASVYWTDAALGTVMKAPLGGGQAATLASGQSGPQGVAVLGAFVYWVNAGSALSGASDGSVVRVAIAGGAAATLASAQSSPRSVAVDGASVYWTNAGGGTVMKASLAGGAPVTVASGQSSPWGLAIDTTSVYWTAAGAGAVMKAPLGGGTAVTLARTSSNPFGVAVDATSVYWADGDDGAIMQAPLAGTDGGAPTVLATGTGETRAIAVDSTSIYWVNWGTATASVDGAVMKLTLAAAATGGAPVVLATGHVNPTGIAVGSGSVYWANSGGGTVLDVPVGGVADGGPPGAIAVGSNQATALAANDSTLYVTSQDGILALPLDGGSRSLLASGLTGPRNLLLDQSNLYFSDVMALSPTWKLIMAMPLAGGTPVTITGVQEAPTSMAIDPTTVYWTANGYSAGTGPGYGVVRSASLDGGTLQPPFLAYYLNTPYGIAVDGTGVYYAGDGVTKVPLDGGAAVPLAAGRCNASGIAIDDAGVYFTQGAPASLLAAPLGGVADGGLAATLASGLGSSTTALAYDGTSIYVAYSDANASYVARVPRGGVADGGAATVLWQGALDVIQALAVDATSVYFVHHGAVLGVTPK